ncbi:MAG: UbiA family prenyltransferase [Gammaproteobacteria bacterium]
MTVSPVPVEHPGFFRRWNTYFSERFPPLQHGVLIAAFTFGVLTYTARVASTYHPPAGTGFVVAFATAFLLILQLRILDEFKDFEEDARWRPYRPVPRGLVSLHSLRLLWFIAAALEVAGALLLDAHLLWGLLVIWSYSGLMGVEFFIPRWLKSQPLVYMLSHIVIVPMIAAYMAACHWLPLNLGAPDLGWLLASSYFTFCVIEVGRKIRSPADEEHGVETYSELWGVRGAVTAWLGFMATSGSLAMLAAAGLDTFLPMAIVTTLVLMIAVATSTTFVRHPRPAAGGRFNTLSGLWTLGLFLGLGISALL